MNERVGKPARISIIGDRFMSCVAFDTAIRACCPQPIELALMELPWPDEPVHHGRVVPGMEALKEYQGDPEEIIRFVGDAEIVVTHIAPFSAAMLSRLPTLKLLAVSRAGPINVDLNAARANGVRVVNTPGRNASAVAEFTIGAMLAETRLITRGHEALRNGVWRGDLYRADLTGRELNTMTVGVIGYGRVGVKVVRLLQAFSSRILVADPYVRLLASDIEYGVVQTSLDRLLSESDVVTLHATRGFLGREQFATMRPGAYFINTARGFMVDYAALIDALKSGRLRGAAIDTFADEPAPADLELLRLENVTLTPHIAGASVQSVEHAAKMIAEDIHRYLVGDVPLNLCP